MLFAYKGINKEGEEKEGTLETESRIEAYQELKNTQGFTAVFYLKERIDNPFINELRSFFEKMKPVKKEKKVASIKLDEDQYDTLVQMIKAESKPRAVMETRVQQKKDYAEKSIDWEAIEVPKVKHKKSGKIKEDEVLLFTKRLAMMTNSGLTLIKALRLLEETATENFSKVLKEIIDAIQNGQTFSQAISSFPKLFDKTYIALAQIGETSGSFGECLRDIVIHKERGRKIKKKVKSASIYPAIMGVFMLVFMTAGSMFLLPKFREIFVEQGMELPALTLMVFAISDRIPMIIGILGASLVGAHIARDKVPRIDYAISTVTSKIVLKMPIVRDVSSVYNMHLFSTTVSLMLKNGLRINDILKLTSKVVKNVYIQSDIERALAMVMSGIPLSEAIGSQKYFDEMIGTIIMTGEESGSLDESLLEISEYYEEELTTKIAVAMEMLQPVFLLVMAAVMIPVIVAIYLPMLGLSTKGGLF